MTLVTLDMNRPNTKYVDLYSHRLNVLHEIAVSFTEDGKALDLITLGATITANIGTANGEYVAADVPVVIANDPSLDASCAKINISSTEDYEVPAGDILIEFKFTHETKGWVKVAASRLRARFIESVLDGATVTDKSYGSIPAAVRELVEARENYESLDKRLDATDYEISKIKKTAVVGEKWNYTNLNEKAGNKYPLSLSEANIASDRSAIYAIVLATNDLFNGSTAASAIVYAPSDILRFIISTADGLFIQKKVNGVWQTPQPQKLAVNSVKAENIADGEISSDKLSPALSAYIKGTEVGLSLLQTQVGELDTALGNKLDNTNGLKKSDIVIAQAVAREETLFCYYDSTYEIGKAVPSKEGLYSIYLPIDYTTVDLATYSPYWKKYQDGATHPLIYINNSPENVEIVKNGVDIADVPDYIHFTEFSNSIAKTILSLENELDSKLDNTTGSVKTNNIAAGAVKSDQIGGSAVTTNKIADGAVTGVKVQDNTLALAKLSTWVQEQINAVSKKLDNAAGAVTGNNIAAKAVDIEKFSDTTLSASANSSQAWAFANDTTIPTTQLVKGWIEGQVEDIEQPEENEFTSSGFSAYYQKLGTFAIITGSAGVSASKSTYNVPLRIGAKTAALGVGNNGAYLVKGYPQGAASVFTVTNMDGSTVTADDTVSFTLTYKIINV